MVIFEKSWNFNTVKLKWLTVYNELSKTLQWIISVFQQNDEKPL